MTDLAFEAPVHGSRDWMIPAAAPAQALSSEIVFGAEAYRDLHLDWRGLGALQHGANLFQMPDLLECWARHFAAAPKTLVTVVVRRPDGRAVLIWPLVVAREGLVRIARGAGTPVGQYDEMLLDPSCDAAEAFAAAAAALMRSAQPDVIVLERVRAGGALHSVIGDVPPIGAAEGAPYADLSQGSTTLMDGLKARVVRQQVKRMRRFEQEGEVGFATAADDAEAEAWLAEAIALKRKWLRDTGRFSRAFLKSETVDCLADCARLLSHPGATPRAVLSRLSLDGRTAAIEMGFCHRGAYHLYLGAFSEVFGKFGPGNILTEKLMHWCADNGIARYDMLAPRSRNKSEWQSGEVEVLDFALPTTMRGRLYVAIVLRRMLPALRKAFYALPDGVRSTLAGVALRKLGRDQTNASPAH